MTEFCNLVAKILFFLMGNNSGIPNSHCRKSSLYINVELAFCFGPNEEGEYLVQVQAEEAKEGSRVPEQSQTHSRCSING